MTEDWGLNLMAVGLLSSIAPQPACIWILIFEWESLVFGDLYATPETVARHRADRDAAQAALDALGGEHAN